MNEQFRMGGLAGYLIKDETHSGQAYDGASAGEPGVFSLFEALEKAGIKYCIAHGSGELPLPQGRDIDIILEDGIEHSTLEAVLRQACDGEKIQLASSAPGVFAFALRNAAGPTRVLYLDFATDCEVGGRLVTRGREFLEGRQRVGRVFAPATALNFGTYLARCMLKGFFDARRQDVLATLWRKDPDNCAAILPRFFGKEASVEIASAFATGNPGRLAQNIPTMQVLAARNTSRTGGLASTPFIAKISRSIRGLVSPRGLSVVMLGPDGAGKSSVIEALSRGLDGLFPNVAVRGFAPPLHRIINRAPKRTDTPHALAPRSLLISLVRAAYWLAYDNWSRTPVHIAKARGGLVLYDRHLLDILVDPVRYRYGGPRFVLDFLVRMAPRPDLVILLNAPGEVLHARKPEMTLAETQRQSGAYLELVRALPNGHVVDASQPFLQVLRNVEDLVICARKDR